MDRNIIMSRLREHLLDARATAQRAAEDAADAKADAATAVADASGAVQVAQGVRDDADAGVFKGDKGDKGDTGEQGIQGIQGLQGLQGIQGDKDDKGDDGYTPVKVLTILMASKFPQRVIEINRLHAYSKNETRQAKHTSHSL